MSKQNILYVFVMAFSSMTSSRLYLFPDRLQYICRDYNCNSLWKHFGSYCHF